MRIRTYLLASGIIVALFSCKKDKDVNPEKEAIRNAADLAGLLKTDASVSIFTDVLKQTALSKEDLDAGITLFTVSNTAFENSGSSKTMARAVTASASHPNSYSDTVASPSLNTSNIRDHIIKGLISFSQLQNGQRLKTESGKTIQVIKSGDSTWVNGLLVEKNTLLHSDKVVAYKLSRALTNTHPKGSIAVTVYDATKWFISPPRGLPLVNYPVYLFHTREDFAATITGTIPKYAYRTLTGNDGIALFTDVIPGKYYLSAGNLNETDTLFAEFNITPGANGVLTGLSSDSLIRYATPPPTQPGAMPGNFYWTDLNGDGIITGQDYMPLPYRSVQTADEGTVPAIILVGKDTLNLEAALQPLINSIYMAAADFDRIRVVADGYMSQDATGSGQWLAFNNFSFNAGTQLIADIWALPWKTIRYANTMIRICNNINSADTDPYEAQARLLRAYSYINLVTSFGDVPLMTEVNMDTERYPGRSPKATVLDFIQQDLEFAAAHLPVNTVSKNFVTKWVATTLLAKTALLKNTSAKAIEYSNAVISSGKYALEADAGSVFGNAGSKEILWTGMDPLSGEFKTYFYNRAIFPTIRYAEVLLMNAEANIRMGNLTAAQNMLNQLQARSRRPPVTLDNNNKFDQLNLIVKAEASREGYHFATLVRIGLADAQLSSLGFRARHVLLPIPERELILDTKMVQNPGY
ncbi:RagB/SusD family nutrient uptake outer membrane protein [Niabella drilacis]|uniref:SusD family protein n=1 Tax=Niabella drilacis (strain DSM 25811 / CCM 8410 / CCUG 62505 / LMG 26954 / E90) TaxID=1285928 RepID=A0A1G6PHD6_NIADE|nr:RagB/SusD family nutrient uptake outer membrane protein [Niabella drilacis]SDC78847.1 SusD family protein [Niabella drilacis]